MFIIFKLLVVDDSAFSQRITAGLLKKVLKNTDICFAKDGQEGIDMYKKVKPDYVFVDLLMPKINGKEMIKLIKNYDENAKIIVVSADVQKSVKLEMEKYDVLMFVNKPMDEEKAKHIRDVIIGGLE